jgi:Zn-dependent peptidase ImmA (M78 family)
VVKDADGRPCIAVNSKAESYRRNYDLAHEYGHVLVHLGKNDRPLARVDTTLAPGGGSSPEERFVDLFAACFLMPRRGVLEQLDRTLRASHGHFTDHDLVHLATHFGVSGQAMSLRLVALRKMPRAAHEAFWKKRDSSFKLMAARLGYSFDESDDWSRPGLPKRFRYLAWNAYELEIISVAKLAELLREDVFELRGRLESLEATHDLAPRA